LHFISGPGSHYLPQIWGAIVGFNFTAENFFTGESVPPFPRGGGTFSLEKSPEIFSGRKKWRREEKRANSLPKLGFFLQKKTL